MKTPYISFLKCEKSDPSIEVNGMPCKCLILCDLDDECKQHGYYLAQKAVETQKISPFEFYSLGSPSEKFLLHRVSICKKKDDSHRRQLPSWCLRVQVIRCDTEECLADVISPPIASKNGVSQPSLNIVKFSPQTALAGNREQVLLVLKEKVKKENLSVEVFLCRRVEKSSTTEETEEILNQTIITQETPRCDLHVFSQTTVAFNLPPLADAILCTDQVWVYITLKNLNVVSNQVRIHYLSSSRKRQHSNSVSDCESEDKLSHKTRDHVRGYLSKRRMSSGCSTTSSINQSHPVPVVKQEPCVHSHNQTDEMKLESLRDRSIQVALYIPLRMAHGESPERILDWMVSQLPQMLTVEDTQGDGMLHIALRQGHKMAVQKFLQWLPLSHQEVRLNDANDEGVTVLMLLAQLPTCDETLADTFLAMGADLKPLDKNFGRSVLHYAVLNGKRHICDVVLRFAKERNQLHLVQQEDLTQRSPFHMAVELCTEENVNSQDILRLLLVNCPDPNHRLGNPPMSAWDIATMRGTPTALKILRANPRVRTTRSTSAVI